MGPDLLESLQILPQFVLQLVGQDLGVLPVTMVLLSVEEPVRDLVLARVLHDGHYSLDLWHVCV